MLQLNTPCVTLSIFFFALFLHLLPPPSRNKSISAPEYVSPGEVTHGGYSFICVLETVKGLLFWTAKGGGVGAESGLKSYGSLQEVSFHDPASACFLSWC